MRLFLSIFRRRFNVRVFFGIIAFLALSTIGYVAMTAYGDSNKSEKGYLPFKMFQGTDWSLGNLGSGILGNSEDSSGTPAKEIIHDQETIDSLLNNLNSPLYPEDEVNETSSKDMFHENLQLYRDTFAKEITEPHVDNLIRPGQSKTNPVKATILSLVRNEDLKDLLLSIRQIEAVFNKKFNYPYTFLNDEEFTEEFKETITHFLPKERVLQFGKIDSELWDAPDNIDKEKYQLQMQVLKDEGIAYATVESYHNMCRFYSKSFYHHPLLKDFKYTWRLEPGVNFYCQIDYDVFKFMEDHDKVYGFVLNLYDGPQSVRTLWQDTFEFVKEHPNYINENNSFEWIKENMQKPENYKITKGYSTCHFWTNIEISSLDFLRSEPYEEYMKFLEEKGGFYYERWGDAPVRSLALGIFADKSKIHWFRDIGYQHFPYTNCPNSKKCDKKCRAATFTPWDNLEVENCLSTWLKYSMTEEQLNMYYET